MSRWPASTVAANFTVSVYEQRSNQRNPGPWRAPPGWQRTRAGTAESDRAAVAEVIAITGDTHIVTLIAATRRRREWARRALAVAVFVTAAFVVSTLPSLTVAALT